MIVLLLKASIILAVLLAFYKFFLEKESFFATNRYYLITCLFLTFIIPFVSLPELISDQGMVANVIEKYTLDKEPEALATTSRQAPGTSITMLEDNSSSPQVVSPNNDPLLIKEETTATNTEVIYKDEEVKAGGTESTGKGLWFWLSMIYYFGVIVLSFNFIAQIFSVLLKVIKSDDKVYDTTGIIVNTKLVQEPCSFFNYIFINPESYDYDTYEQILSHEKIHVKKLHTLDLLLSEIAVIVLWFNPFVWGFRKEVEKNIEYQTDDLLLTGASVKKDQYQMNLLKVATYSQPLAITTNYNQSLIKQRILKMSAKKSNPYSFWKYAFLLPILFTLLLVINKPTTIMAQQGVEQEEALDNRFTEQFENLSDQEKEEVHGLLKKLDDPKSIERLKELNFSVEPEEIHTFESLSAKEQAEIKDRLKNQGYNYYQRDVDDAEFLERIEKAKNMEGLDKFEDLDEEQQRDIIESLTNPEKVKTKEKVSVEIDLESLSEEDRAAILRRIGGGQDMGMGEMGVPQKLKEGEKLDESQMIKIPKTENTEGANESSNAKEQESQDLLKAVKDGNTSKVSQLLQTTNPNFTYRSSARDTMVVGGYEFYIRTSQSPLVAASRVGNLEIAKLLIEANADVEFHAREDETPLLAAAAYGHLDLVKYLLANGAVLNKSMKSKGTPLLAAARNGYTEVVKYLHAQGGDIEQQVYNQGTPVLVAARNGHVETVKYLVSKGMKIDQVIAEETPLLVAARNGHTSMVTYLLAQGAKIDEVRRKGSPLSVAARNGHTETIELLLAKGAQTDVKVSGDGTALLVASRNGHLEAVKLLLAKGADVNKRANGGTALSNAAKNGHHDIAEALLEKGADPFQVSSINPRDRKMVDLLRKYEDKWN